VSITVVMLVAGCGSGGGETPAQYNYSVDQVCSDEAAQVRALPPLTTLAQAGPRSVGLRRIVDSHAAALEQRVPPSELSGLVRRALVYVRRGRALVDRLAAEIAAGANPQPALLSFEQHNARVTRQANAAWRRIGALGCVA